MTDLIDAALAEDVGDGDVTTEATVDAAVRGRATITQKAPGVISGLKIAEAVFRRLDPEAEVELVTLLGFVSHLGPIANWGLEFANKRQIKVNQTCETNLPGVYAAGDVAGFDGKITLITVGFSEAALAANHAVARTRGEKAQPKYSTE